MHDDGHFAIHRHLTMNALESVVTTGYLGLEMIDALTRCGLDVTVVEYAPSVLPMVDPAFGQIISSDQYRISSA